MIEGNASGGEGPEGLRAAIYKRVSTERGSRFAPSQAGRRPSRHVFTGRVLRCGICGEAMLPRSDPDMYTCRTNKQLKGAGSCPMPNHSREVIDARFLALFEAEYLDYTATRDRVAVELDRSLTDIQAQAASAGSEVARIEGQRQRVERDYLTEELGATAYDRLSTKLADEAEAAAAQLERLQSHAARVGDSLANLDAESETLRRLTALRDTVASHAREAAAQEDLDALRGVIAMAFEHVYLRHDGGIASMTPGVATRAAALEGTSPISMLTEVDGEIMP